MHELLPQLVDRGVHGGVLEQFTHHPLQLKTRELVWKENISRKNGGSHGEATGQFSLYTLMKHCSPRQLKVTKLRFISSPPHLVF